MKKTLLILITILFSLTMKAQVLCILCFDQNDSISSNVTNLILNGGFENSTCGTIGYFCPNSSFYSCDLTNWTCTGGGSNTYAHNSDASFSMVNEGTYAAYLGNFYANACSNIADDTSCLSDTACTMNPLPPGFPTNTIDYGGNTGVSIEQTVNGLTPGATYVLEFWAGGEGNIWPNRGVFGVDVGFGDTLLRNKETNSFSTDIGTRYIVEFTAVSTSHTIKFTNWGHICSDCTELILDDVKLYPIAQLNTSIAPCPGIDPIALFSAPHHICPGTCTDFTNLSLNCLSFQWSFPGATPAVSTDANPTGICYNSPGSYSVTLIASNMTSSDTLSLNNYITVYPYPPPQGISQSGDTLFANAGAVSYQWYDNGNLIPGATDYFYVAPHSGDYSVVATDQNTCEVEAAIFDVVAGLQELTAGNMQLSIIPNPVKDKFTVRNSNFKMSDTGVVTIYNVLGEKVMSLHSDLSRIDVHELSPGLYYLEIQDNKNFLRAKFVKE